MLQVCFVIGVLCLSCCSVSSKLPSILMPLRFFTSGGKCDIDGGAHEVTNTTLEMYGALFKHMNDSTKRESTLTTSVKSSDKAKFEALSVENEKEAVLNIAKSFEKSVELVRSAEGEKKVFNMFCKKCMRYFEAVHDFSSI